MSTGTDFIDFAALLNSDASDTTGAFSDGDDVVLVFQRDALGEVVDSIRLEDVIGDDGITAAAFESLEADDVTDEVLVAV